MQRNIRRCIALKIDFKIVAGKLRILDLGDGLGAGLTGFDDKNLGATLLHDLHEINDGLLATPFGELPCHAMHEKTLHIPLAFRTVPLDQAYSNVEDLSSKEESILPFSESNRIQGDLAYDWSKKLDNVANTSISLIAMEMHKIFLYVLMKKSMRIEDHEKVIYWMNDTSPEVDLSQIDIKNGVFIKIADRSIGGGDEVYYAKDENEVKNILQTLQKKYLLSNESYKKHIFIIEPAYVTIKKHKYKGYNVTGRAFVTLGFDPQTRNLSVKIAAAKWMFPNKELQDNKTEDQMLSNVKHTIGMAELNKEELNLLFNSILDSYGEFFKTAFENDDMIAYCKDDPVIDSFLLCLRPNSAYNYQLKLHNQEYNAIQYKELLINQINSMFFRDMLKEMKVYYTASCQKLEFFSVKQQQQLSPDDLMYILCRYSFYEGYLKFSKECPDFIVQEIKKHVPHPVFITRRFNDLIVEYLKIKNHQYDTQDFNRALRQAASACDIAVIKLLVYTHRADVNACSPTTHQTPLDFLLASKNQTVLKDQCLNLLRQAGAKKAKDLKEIPSVQAPTRIRL